MRQQAHDGLFSAHYAIFGRRMHEDEIFKLVRPENYRAIKDESGHTLKHYAAMKHQPRILAQLPFIDNNECSQNGKTPMHYFLETPIGADDEFVFSELQPGLTGEHRDNKGNSYLHYAAIAERLAVMNYFLHQGLQLMWSIRKALLP